MPHGSPRFPRRAIALLVVSLFTLLLKGQAEVVISELMAQNVSTTVIDEDGEHSDWIELQNNGATDVTLNGWYLTDDKADLQKWRFPLTSPSVSLAPGARLVVWCSGKNRKVAANRLHTNFNLERNGEYLGLIRPDGFSVEFEYAPQYPPQFNNSVYGLSTAAIQQELIGESATGKASVPIDQADFDTNFNGWNSSVAFNDSNWQTGEGGFGFDTTNPPQNIIGPQVSATGNLQAAMQGKNASGFIRYVVDIADPAAITSLILKVKYDDGYLCYLNGNLIAKSLAPASVTWNSASEANTDRADAIAAIAETASTLNAQSFLVPGKNVFAFQMLNNSAENETALLRPQVLATMGTHAFGYFVTPTPGNVNGALQNNFGPSISQVTDRPPQPVGGAASEPLLITAKVVPTLRPLAADSPVVLKSRVMYTPETAITMVDDGTNGDVAANDGIYTAQVPTTTLTAGQMIRWRVEAKDNTNIYSYDPPYPFSATAPPANPPPVIQDASGTFGDVDQYHGTVAVQPSLANSLLPALHWFVQPSQVGLTQSTSGASCSFFYLGQFYDNVRVELHGQSSSGFPTSKKSHNVNFTKINRFKWKDGQPRVRAMNLLTNYADKTKVRNEIAWGAWEKSGHIMSHWCEQIRVEQNGTFWGVYDMVEDGNEDFLERFGFNPYDALYKIYDTMDSLAQAEQKTREDVDVTPPLKADYQALLNGLNTATAISTRRQYAYDNVDIASLVNAQAVHPLINNNDWGHKNFYMFRNTTGTGEWSPIPWDQDLSSGHTWQSGPAYFNDEIDSQRGLQNGANNRLRQLVYSSPEINNMFVRRVRTLADEFYGSVTATTGFYEERVPQILDQIDPLDIPQGVKSDGRLDFEKWGFWLNGSGSPLSFTNAAGVNHTIRAQAARLITSNPTPNPYPGSATGSIQGNNTTFTFVEGRRRFLYSTAANSGGVVVPQAPLVTPSLVFEAVDFNPASGNGEQEYFIIKNMTPGVYVDISGWRVTGAGGATTDNVDYIFRGGTVIPPFTGNSAITATGDVHTGRLHVARNPAQFRARTESPKRGEFRYIVGPYNGHLSARGGTLELRNKANEVVATKTWEPAPTAFQSALRITELNYNPTAPTPAEAQSLPGLNASNFEFIELTNSGAAPLDLGGATFDKGVTFTFPAGFTLNPGSRCVVVANQAAFQLRFGTSLSIAGEFEGNLDNNGETIRLLDGSGEEVLEFRYDPDWYGLPDSTALNGITSAAGYSLVTRTSDAAYDSYEKPLTWALSRPLNGTPGVPDSGYSSVYYGWLHDFFTPTEQATAVATPGADADEDGRSNFSEYTDGTDPRVVDTGTSLSRALVSVGSDRFPGVRFSGRASTADVTWIVEASSDGSTWRTLAPELSARVAAGAGSEDITYRDSEAAGPGTRSFRVHAKYLSGYETPVRTIENRAPTAEADNATTRETAVTIQVLSNDADADNDPITVRSVSSPAQGSAVLNGDGSITYTPGAGFAAAGKDTFTYTIADAFGGEVQGAVTVSLTNRPPVAGNDSVVVRPGSISIPVLTNDSDSDGDNLSVATASTPANGTVTIQGGAIVYTAGATFSGSDTFTYTVTDGVSVSPAATVTVTNNPPQAVDDVLRVAVGAPASSAVAANDLENDPGQSLTVSIATSPTQGTATVEGNKISYTAGASFTGTDTFTYTVSDGFGGTDTGTVRVVDELMAAATGVYRGLVSDESNASIGTLEVKLSTRGEFTGQLWYLADRYTGKGVFVAGGTANVVFKGRKGLTRNVTLQLEAEENEVSGTVTDGTSNNTLTLKRFTAAYSAAAPCPQSGGYSAILAPDPAHVDDPAYPQGSGTATMSVSSRGVVKAKGKLGDDSKFVVRGTVDQDGVVVIHTPLYKKPKGFLCGEATFVANDPTADQRGVLTWRKPAQQKASPNYPAGFSGSTLWQASRVPAIPKGTPILGTKASTARITMKSGGLAEPLVKTVAVTATGISVQNTGSDALKLDFELNKGLFSGSYVHPKDGKKRSMSGVLYHKQKIGRGSFSGISDSGQAITGDWMLSPE